MGCKLQEGVYLPSQVSCQYRLSSDRGRELVRLRWAGLPPGSVASRRRAVGCGGQRRRERSSSCSGTKGRRGPRSGELPRLLERGGGWAGGVARRGALFRGQGGSTATFRNSLSLEEYGLMSPSALFGGSFRAGAAGMGSATAARECRVALREEVGGRC